VSDLVVTVAPIGLFFGRLANFMNGELWGKPTSVPWAMIFIKTGGGPEPRHPSQLYEAGLEGLLLFAFLQWRFWKSPKAQTQPGRIAGEFLVAYALVRSLGEIFREPDEGVSLILGLSRGTFYSLFMIVAGVALIAYASRRKASQLKS
jgi:phosphatidylglycerol:prolipoprotein diacylglycerol transferase